MNILIVTAHPSSQGFTHRIAETYAAGARENGHTVEILDLYKTELQQGYLRFEDIREKTTDSTRDAMQQKIAWADELMIVHPLWWFDAPAIMKNWFDVNFTSGFAFKYERSFIPRRLLKGKSARVFITADGPWWFYLFIKPFKINWWLGRLWTCGVKLKTFRLLCDKRLKTPEDLEKWLEKVFRIAKKSK